MSDIIWSTISNDHFGYAGVSNAGGGKKGGRNESKVEEGHKSMGFHEMMVMACFRAVPWKDYDLSHVIREETET